MKKKSRGDVMINEDFLGLRRLNTHCNFLLYRNIALQAPENIHVLNNIDTKQQLGL